MDRDRLRRITRLLKILTLLQSGKRLGLASLAEACGCSTKTIQRDLSYWREMDVCIDYIPERHAYEISGDLPFKLLDLHLFEATSLALAEAAVASAQGLSLKRSIDSAFKKIHEMVPRDVAECLDDCCTALITPDSAKRDYSRAPLLKLIEAFRRRLTASVDYESRSSGRRTRPIEPYRIAFLDGFWIVIARDPERDEVRNFALDRIHACDLIYPDRPFRIPSGWSLESHMAGSVGVLRGERTEIALRFEKEAVPWLSGRRWRFAAEVSEPAAGGSVTLTGTVAGLEEITSEILRWGKHVTVLSPETLREKVAAEARAIAAKYP
jgi:predicted DNA-binding transcriptional regulator YafY